MSGKPYGGNMPGGANVKTPSMGGAAGVNPLLAAGMSGKPYGGNMPGGANVKTPSMGGVAGVNPLLAAGMSGKPYGGNMPGGANVKTPSMGGAAGVNPLLAAGKSGKPYGGNVSVKTKTSESEEEDVKEEFTQGNSKNTQTGDMAGVNPLLAAGMSGKLSPGNTNTKAVPGESGVEDMKEESTQRNSKKPQTGDVAGVNPLLAAGMPGEQPSGNMPGGANVKTPPTLGAAGINPLLAAGMPSKPYGGNVDMKAAKSQLTNKPSLSDSVNKPQKGGVAGVNPLLAAGMPGKIPQGNVSGGGIMKKPPVGGAVGINPLLAAGISGKASRGNADMKEAAGQLTNKPSLSDGVNKPRIGGVTGVNPLLATNIQGKQYSRATGHSADQLTIEPSPDHNANKPQMVGVAGVNPLLTVGISGNQWRRNIDMKAATGCSDSQLMNKQMSGVAGINPRLAAAMSGKLPRRNSEMKATTEQSEGANMKTPSSAVSGINPGQSKDQGVVSTTKSTAFVQGGPIASQTNVGAEINMNKIQNNEDGALTQQLGSIPVKAANETGIQNIGGSGGRPNDNAGRNPLVGTRNIIKTMSNALLNLGRTDSESSQTSKKPEGSEHDNSDDENIIEATSSDLQETVEETCKSDGLLVAFGDLRKSKLEQVDKSALKDNCSSEEDLTSGCISMVTVNDADGNETNLKGDILAAKEKDNLSDDMENNDTKTISDVVEDDDVENTGAKTMCDVVEDVVDAILKNKLGNNESISGEVCPSDVALTDLTPETSDMAQSKSNMAQIDHEKLRLNSRGKEGRMSKIEEESGESQSRLKKDRGSAEAPSDKDPFPVDSTFSPKGMTALEARYSSHKAENKNSANIFIPKEPVRSVVLFGRNVMNKLTSSRSGDSLPVNVIAEKTSVKMSASSRLTSTATSGRMKKAVSFSNNVELKNSSDKLVSFPMASQTNAEPPMPNMSNIQAVNAQWKFSQNYPNVAAGTGAYNVSIKPPTPTGLNPNSTQRSHPQIGMHPDPSLMSKLKGIHADKSMYITGMSREQILKSNKGPSSGPVKMSKPQELAKASMRKNVSFADDIVQSKPQVSTPSPTIASGDNRQGNADWSLGQGSNSSPKFKLNRPSSLVGLEFALNNISIEKSSGKSNAPNWKKTSKLGPITSIKEPDDEDDQSC
jgi:hypothetical protein